MTNKQYKPEKAFAPITEREKIRRHFVKRAGEAPIPNPFSAESMEAWWDYVDDMREIEQQLKDAGERL